MVKLQKGYDWKITAKKALRPGLLAGAGAIAGAVAMGVDAEALINLGIPAALAPFAVEGIRNWAKNKDK